MCKKRKYTKMGALYSIVNAQHKKKKNKADKIPVRAYYCKWCACYHLSSQQRLNIKTGVIG
ncbi:hypothetical protein 56301_26 [Lactococcus phage 56301]|uniref:Uncharacterized protein n=1 Tax=Lactococcus phage 56301 TaxID=2029666 RepID=A0A343JPN4_9CAUD|nr:hypothetical protein HYP32_gp26 [Lactococcus phage 56301]ASZ71457.1 hypothetical protein 56301_26 [Lactococcus phage 56301]